MTLHTKYHCGDSSVVRTVCVCKGGRLKQGSSSYHYTVSTAIDCISSSLTRSKREYRENIELHQLDTGPGGGMELSSTLPSLG